MDGKVILAIPLGIAILYYGIFKLKAKENLYAKIVALTVAIVAEIILASRILFEKTIIYPVVLVVGIIAIFSVLTVLAWKERKNPDKRTYIYVYFSIMGFLVLFAIVVFILARTGFFG